MKRVFKFGDDLNKTKDYKKYNNLLKKLGVMNDNGDIDLENAMGKINDFLSKDGNKDKFLKDLSDETPNLSNKKIKVKKLKPSQDEIFLDNVIPRLVVKDEFRDKVLNGHFKDNNILISSDNHIIDGHHRWASAYALNPNCKIKCSQFNIPIVYAIPIINSMLKTDDEPDIKIKKYKIDTFKFIKSPKDKFIKKLDSMIKDAIENGAKLDEEIIKSEIKTVEEFYDDIKNKLDIKDTLKHIRKNIKKIQKPNEYFPDRSDIPQMNKKKKKIL